MNNQPNNSSLANILIVDDTLPNLRLLSKMLTEQGYKVRGVPNGATALKAARLAPPDLILLDINMPNMNGYEVCKRLKDEPQTRNIPIIFISALDEILDKVKSFSLGGVDYITKPFQFEEILARVKTHLALYSLQKQLKKQNNMLQQQIVERQEAEVALQKANDELELRVEERTKQLVKLNAAYETFVPKEFLSVLKKESILEVKLGDQIQQDMTILFSDIRSFTTLSEQMTPQENFNFINDYLSRVSPVIREHDGFIDKFMGDGLMALFPGLDDPALQAAIGMQQTIADYNLEREAQGEPAIYIGVGLHTGSVMLGTVGEAERMEGTVISDAVNLAARLEGLTKLYGASIVVSEGVLYNLNQPTQYNFRFLDKVKVKGKKEPVSVFEIFDGQPESVTGLKLKTRTDFEMGLLHYHSEEFSEASVKFNNVLTQDPEDKAAQLYIKRSAYFLTHGVPPDWTGITALLDK